MSTRPGNPRGGREDEEPDGRRQQRSGDLDPQPTPRPAAYRLATDHSSAYAAYAHAIRRVSPGVLVS